MIRPSMIVLVGSLTVNVFLIGVGIGVFITGARITPGGAKTRPAPNVWVAAQALPPHDRVKFRAMLREQVTALAPDLKTVRESRQGAAALIAASTFDPKAVAATLDRARTGEIAARAKFDEGFIAYLSTMPQKERADLADAMVRSRPGNVRAALRADDPAGEATAQALPSTK